jgi:hypothetical protein
MKTDSKIEFRISRDFGELLMITFAFIRQNFTLFSKSIVYISGPIMILYMIHTAYFQMDIWDFNNLSRFDDSFILHFLLSVIISFFLTSVITLVPIKFIQLYREKGAHHFSITEVWLATQRQIFMMLFTQLGLGVIILFAFIFLIIPGIYASVVLSLVIIIRVLENKNFSQAISRSVELIKKNWWFTFGFLLVMYLIVGIMSLVFQIPVYILLFVTAFQSADPTAIVGESGFLFSLSMAWSALATFLYAIFPVGLVFHYFNLVEKKEAKGLKERIEQI